MKTMSHTSLCGPGKKSFHNKPKVKWTFLYLHHR